MFDDEKMPGQVPGNLPFAPEPATTHNPSAAEGNSMMSPHGHEPDALDAGLLKRKNEGMEEPLLSPPLPPATSPFTAPLPPSSQPLAAMTYATKEPVLGKILAGVLTVAAIGVIALGGWYGYKRIVQPLLAGKKDVEAGQVTTSTPEENTSAGAVTTTPTIYRSQTSTSSIQGQTDTDTLLFGEQTDTDHDNLPDRRERELGTDPNKADTDADGLNEGDEIIWGTDPLNPDSDGDGYKDGSEVKNGYNPLGPGKLFGGDASSTTSVSSTPVSSSSVSSTIIIKTSSSSVSSSPTSSSSTGATPTSSNNVPSL